MLGWWWWWLLMTGLIGYFADIILYSSEDEFQRSYWQPRFGLDIPSLGCGGHKTVASWKDWYSATAWHTIKNGPRTFHTRRDARRPAPAKDPTENMRSWWWLIFFRSRFWGWMTDQSSKIIIQTVIITLSVRPGPHSSIARDARKKILKIHYIKRRGGLSLCKANKQFYLFIFKLATRQSRAPFYITISLKNKHT